MATRHRLGPTEQLAGVTVVVPGPSFPVATSSSSFITGSPRFSTGDLTRFGGHPSMRENAPIKVGKSIRAGPVEEVDREY
jgi:hypothetical protein